MDSISVIEINSTEGRHARPTKKPSVEFDAGRAMRNVARIAAVAAKLGLYAGTAVLIARAIIKASEIAQERMVILGSEIFTIPMIIAIFLVGWTFRGDVEKAIRQFFRRKRRETRERRG